MTIRLLAAVVVIGTAFALSQAPPFVVTTGSPRLIETGSAGTTLVMTEAQYQRFVDETGRASPDFVAIDRSHSG